MTELLQVQNNALKRKAYNSDIAKKTILFNIINR